MSDGIRADGRMDISAGCLHPATSTCRDMQVIESVMLWPGDAGMRRSALQTMDVFVLSNHPDFRGVSGQDLLRLAAETEPLGNISRLAAGAYRSGLTSGFILHDTVGMVKLGLKEASIGRSIENASKSFKPIDHLSVKTINRIWAQYKPVSHLWSAHFIQTLDGADTEFPCHYSKCAEFLALAEGYRKLGETVRTFQSPNAALPRGVALRLPFELPAVYPEFSQAD